MVKKIIYEHRDEPPIKEYTYESGKRFTFRRCYTGVILDGLPFVDETQIVDTGPESNGVDYKNKYEDILYELKDIIYDISPEEAKRKIVNIRRFIETRLHEMSK